MHEARGVRPFLAVCNAGRGLLGPLEVHSADDVASVLDVNLVGTVRVLQAFLPDMKRRLSGRILVTGSMGGLVGEWKGPGGVGGDAVRCLRLRALRLSVASSPLKRDPLQRRLLCQQVRDRRFM